MQDQKVKADAGKLELTLVPRQMIREVAKVRMYGNRKYPDGGPDNWKKVSAERYRDAMFRHMLAYLDDPYGVDAESGLPHLSHIACNVAFLCELDLKHVERQFEQVLYAENKPYIAINNNGEAVKYNDAY